MLRIRTAAISLAAAGAAALTLGLTAGPAVAHGFGHHDFFGHHRWHAIQGTVQSIDVSASTAVISLGADRRSMHRDWEHGGASSSGTRTVSLDLSGASIFDAGSMWRHCHGPSGAPTPSSTTSLSAIQPGDVVAAFLAVDHFTARQDVESGSAIPVRKLVDFGQPGSNGSDQSHRARRFSKRT
jgi:hypothetical protein